MRKLILVALLTLLVGASAGTAQAHRLNVNRFSYGERISHQVHHNIRGTHLCQIELGIPRTKSRGRFLRLGVDYRRYVLRAWLKRHQDCGQLLRQTRRCNFNWYLAMDCASRVFPGSRGWLEPCSRSEGGHTDFVWNRDLRDKPNKWNVPGGWMQFMPSTFYSHVHSALAETKRRGQIVLKSWYSHDSQAGQAFTGAYMWNNGGTGHWTGSGC